MRISPPPPPSLPLASGASFRLAERGEEKEGDSAWISLSLWSHRSPNFWASQYCFIPSNYCQTVFLFFKCEHPFIDNQQSAIKWVETLRPKWTFWRFPDFKRGKDSVSSPIPSMQCCATVRATFRKQETSQLWMEGTGEGCGFLCFRSYPIWVQCLNNFVAYWSPLYQAHGY